MYAQGVFLHKEKRGYVSLLGSVGGDGSCCNDRQWKLDGPFSRQWAESMSEIKVDGFVGNYPAKEVGTGTKGTLGAKSLWGKDGLFGS